MIRQKKVLTVLVAGFILLLLSGGYFSPFKQILATTCDLTNSGAAIRMNNGLLSFRNLDDYDNSNFYFLTPPIQYLCGDEAGMGIPSSFRDYGDMKKIYFDQAPAGITRLDLDPGLNPPSLDLASYSGQTVLFQVQNSNPFLLNNVNFPGNPARTVAVVFVDGDLEISGNLTHNDGTSGLVFVVGGRTLIDYNVSRVDAVIVSYGEFLDAWDGGSCGNATTALTINGSVIYLNTDTSSIKPQFCRNLANDSDPAEILNYQPKYLVILKEVFAREESYWNEL